jgi:hypothetical protein
LKEPDKVLDSFRTDVGKRHLHSALLRQFDLEFPHGKRQRNKSDGHGRGMVGTAAVLSLLLVTGLSVGMGSAFAENEWVKDDRPPDLPAVKPKVEIRLPVVGSSEMENTNPDGVPEEIKKVNPDAKGKEKKINAPREEPPVSDSPVEGEQTTSQPPREVIPSPGSSGKGEEHGGLPQYRNGSSQSSGVSKPPTNHPPRQVAPTPGSSGKGEEHGALMQYRGEPSKSSGGTVSKPHRNSTERHILVFGRVTAGQKSRSVPSGGKGTQKTAGTGNDSAKQFSRSSPQTSGTVTGNRPKTVKGGVLPQTAGNDLNGVAAGGAVALVGVLHALRRSRVNPS